MARCCRRGPVRGSVQLPASGVSPCSRTRYRFFWWIKSIVSYIPRFFPYYHKTFSMLKKHTSILKKNTTIKLFSGTIRYYHFKQLLLLPLLLISLYVGPAGSRVGRRGGERRWRRGMSTSTSAWLVLRGWMLALFRKAVYRSNLIVERDVISVLSSGALSRPWRGFVPIGSGDVVWFSRKMMVPKQKLCSTSIFVELVSRCRVSCAFVVVCSIPEVWNHEIS